MARPRKTPDNTDLMTWAEIGRRMDMPIKDVKATYDTAIRKLHAACVAQGITLEMLQAYFRDRDREDQLHERVRQLVNLYHSDVAP